MSDEKQIREIEKKIDEFYKGSAFIQTYKGNRRQALFDLLRAYECLSITAVVSGIGEETQGLENPEQTIFQSAHNLQDALNTSVQWIYNDCEERDVPLSYSSDHTATMAAITFLINYADPYAVISDGYISYSRKSNTGRVDNNRVIFDSTDSKLSSFAIDVGDRLNEDNSSFEKSINATMLSADFQSALNDLQNSIVIKNERLSYQISENLKEYCRGLAKQHWNYKSTVPRDWKFDNYTLQEFKLCWIELYVICQIHFMVKIRSRLPGFAYQDGIICLKKDELLNNLQQNVKIEREHISNILKALTYDPSLRNTDIMYQPLVEVGDSYLITPNLILVSNPERNMLSVIQKKKDSKYSVEVNKLENIMCAELASVLPERTLYKTDCKIGKDNPDIDFTIYDSVSNSILIAEMKWLIAADSSKELPV